jgi:MFS family permease
VPAPVPEIKLGDSFAALPGPWKFAPGDSPEAGGNLLWTDPAFDDSSWADMDLHPRPGETDPGYGNASYLTGWSARGFPHLAGFAWYRLRIHVSPSTEPLWLKMPDHTDDSYQVFANGRYLGEFGHFTASGVDNYRSRPITFQLPPPDQDGDIVLAIRFYMEPWVLIIGTTGDSGGMHQTPLIGLRSQIESIRQQEIVGRVLGAVTSIFVTFMMLIAAAGALWIWLIDRSHRTYLWLTLALVFTAGALPALLIALFTYLFTQGVSNIAVQGFSAAGMVCWIIFWRSWFRLARNRWLDILLVAFATAAIVIPVLIAWSEHFPPDAILFGFAMRVVANGALGALLFVALLQGASKDRTGALLALPPILLLAISLFSTELLAWFHVRTAFFPMGFQVSLKDVSLVLLLLVVGALVARRFIGSQVSQRLERQAVDQELEQARELQQRVLVPEPVTSSTFTVESAYYPARTVGGDFYQIVPHPDGSLLIVVGDVSGKGMAAAMLVAVLVGAMRTRADQTFDPAAILHSLNDRMMGRSGDHFATCIVAHIRPGGLMLIGNAGHIPPYRNGVAMDLPGSIPLGIIQGAQYEVQVIQLDPADRLTFVTDGIPEARNATGGLLGFDELARLSSLPPEAIAEAAIDYGQEDDITIVSVRLRAAVQTTESSAVFATSPA